MSNTKIDFVHVCNYMPLFKNSLFIALRDTLEFAILYSQELAGEEELLFTLFQFFWAGIYPKNNYIGEFIYFIPWFSSSPS